MQLNLQLKKENKIQLTIKMYESNHKELKDLCNLYGVSMTDFIHHSLNSTIEQLNNNG